MLSRSNYRSYLLKGGFLLWKWRSSEIRILTQAFWTNSHVKSSLTILWDSQRRMEHQDRLLPYIRHQGLDGVPLSMLSLLKSPSGNTGSEKHAVLFVSFIHPYIATILQCRLLLLVLTNRIGGDALLYYLIHIFTSVSYLLQQH